MNVNPIFPANGRLLAANGGETRGDAMRQALIAGRTVMQTVRHIELAVLWQKRADATLRIQVNHRNGVAVADSSLAGISFSCLPLVLHGVINTSFARGERAVMVRIR